MSEQKLVLLSLRNKNWDKVKVETEKVNKSLQLNPTKYISELNELFYVGAKIIRDKIGDPLRNKNRNTKPGWKKKDWRNEETATTSETATEGKIYRKPTKENPPQKNNNKRQSENSTGRNKSKGFGERWRTQNVRGQS